MASKARRISNNAGSANSFLNAVDKPNKGEVKIAKAVALSGKQKDLVSAIMLAVKQCLDDSDDYQKKLDSKSIDVTLGRIASLLDEFGDTLGKDQIGEAKDEILEKIAGISSDLSLKLMLTNAVSSLFDDAVSKDDIEELKKWMSENIGQTTSSSNVTQSQTRFESSPSLEESTENAKEGDYEDSTPAKNFMTLQTYINKQFDVLNENIKNIPGQSELMSKMFKAIGVGFGATFSGITKLTKGVAKTISKTASIAKSLGKFTIGGLFKIVSGVAKGVGSVIKGIGSLGKKVGGAIASPFKKIGGFFASLNPFKRSEKKAEERKQKAKDKIMEIMAKVVEKIWKAVEPFIDKVAFFMGLVTKFVIVPIALIALKVLLIVAAITAIGVGLVLAYFWIKKKIAGWVEYFKSGQWWEDLKAKMLAAWEWMKDFGKWIGQKLAGFGKWLLKAYLRYLKFVWIDIPVWIGKKLAEFGIWLWDKLCEFGQWLYDNYIDKYLVQPFKQYIWEPIKKLWNEKIWPKIEPFITSLTELKDKIVKAFSAWDSNKSIWENLKNMTSIIKDAVVEWWNGSPFKEFYDKHLDPIVKSLGDLINRIKAIWANIKWDENKSFIDNLKDIGGILVDGIKEWWNATDNPIRATWDKVIEWFKDMTKPIVEWYEKSKLKEWIDKLVDFGKSVKDAIVKWWNESDLKKWINNFSNKLKEIKNTLGNMIWDVPVLPLMRPFGFLIGKSIGLSGKEKEEYKQKEKFNELQKELDDISTGKRIKSWGKDITDKRKKEIENEMAKMGMTPHQIAAQQVQNAAQPLQQIESMKNESTVELKKTSESINKDIAMKEEKQQRFDAQQADKSDKILARLDSMDNGLNKKLDDPYVFPFPYATSQQQNPATMETY